MKMDNIEFLSPEQLGWILAPFIITDEAVERGAEVMSDNITPHVDWTLLSRRVLEAALMVD